MKQSIAPLPLVLVLVRVEFDPNSIGLVVFEVALVNPVKFYFCLFTEAIASIFNKLALVLFAIRPSVDSLTIIFSINEFTLIYSTINGLLASARSLAILELPLIPAIRGDKHPPAMKLVIVPVSLILNVLVTFGIHHLAFAFSFCIPQLPGV